ncbi:MAG: tRNA-dihydrouridine synthase A [Candidatus Azotimanducaceae bacterium]|jgi:tRNA-dihydrouridine synthase A
MPETVPVTSPVDRHVVKHVVKHVDSPATEITANPRVKSVPAPLDRTLSLAPMMGCTDRHCRYLFRLLSPNTLMYSEMLVTGALIYNRADKFLLHGGDEPCAVQLGGNDPKHLSQCAQMVEDAGYQEVNINVGCPSSRVQSGGIGAALMATPHLVADCVAAMQAQVKIPVTVKTRIGIDDMDHYEHFYHFIDTVHAAGCRIFIIHARKAILGGLSPKENREIPPLKYDFVYKIRHAFPDCQFILNGGINDVESALALLPKVDGLMLGRAPYANPWLLAELDAALYKHEAIDRMTVLQQYMDYMERQQADGEPFRHMVRHLMGWFTGMRGARTFRRELGAHMFEANADVGVVKRALHEAGLSNVETSDNIYIAQMKQR